MSRSPVTLTRDYPSVSLVSISPSLLLRWPKHVEWKPRMPLTGPTGERQSAPSEQHVLAALRSSAFPCVGRNASPPPHSSCPMESLPIYQTDAVSGRHAALFVQTVTFLTWILNSRALTLFDQLSFRDWVPSRPHRARPRCWSEFCVHPIIGPIASLSSQLWPPKAEPKLMEFVGKAESGNFVTI